MSAAPELEEHAMTQDDLVKAADAKGTVGKEVIRELRAEGLLTEVGEGKRGDPYRYFLSDVTPTPRAAEKIVPFPHPSEIPNDPDGARAYTAALAIELGFPRVQGFCIGGASEWQRFAAKAPREVLHMAVGELEELGDRSATG